MSRRILLFLNSCFSLIEQKIAYFYKKANKSANNSLLTSLFARMGGATRFFRHVCTHRSSMARHCGAAPTRYFATVVATLASVASVLIYLDWRALDIIYQNGESSLSLSSDSQESVRVLQQYKEWHSHDSLVRQLELANNNTSRQLFAVVYYSCPHRSGNILHSFFNAAIWAIVNNRTLLFSYDEEAAHNTIEDCNHILSMNDWVPSYDQWSTALQLPPPVPIKMNTRRTKKQLGGRLYSRAEQLDSMQHQVVIYPHIPDVQPENPLISRVSWWEDPRRLTRPCFRNIFYFQRRMHLSSSWSKTTLDTLYSEGLYFLYGLLFREFFTIHTTVEPLGSVQPSPAAHTTLTLNKKIPAISIALHSRHSNSVDDGSNIEGEVRCLERWVVATPTASTIATTTETNPATLSCVVYLMSDRNATLYKLADWLAQHNCTALWAPHPTLDHSNAWGSNAEHGPFAGQDFFRDLSFCAQAATAIVGDFTRSSTVLLLDLISYDRRQRYTDHDNPPSLQRCNLPDRPEGLKRG